MLTYITYELPRPIKRQRCTLTKTRPKAASIGQRRKPCPNDQPGYIRIDSVHQGDLDKRKGIYHVNAVDEVTQFQVIATLERISEAFMRPALEQMLATFPFKIRGFHADNGSEYINYTVAELLDTLRIEFTKSRSRHSNDNGRASPRGAAIGAMSATWGMVPVVPGCLSRLGVANTLR